MKEKVKALTDQALREIGESKTQSALNDIRVRVLGKSGELTALLRNMKDLSPEERPEAGKIVNEAREKLEEAIAARLKTLDEETLNKRLKEERIDITIDEKTPQMGGYHPLTIVRNKIVDFFTSLGCIIADSPEIETDYYNFEALNIPADHPAREMQDTFFVTDNILLRSQTSAGQIRTMEKIKPPLKMLSPGRVFRADEVDATHSPVFHQIEGLVVDKGITLCDLKGTLDLFAKQFFGAQTKTRFRPSYFPFTEPSVEVDASCARCGGTGCNVCKGTGWIEILGAGMVNRNVLVNCGIDPDEYTGFAFGVGLDRITNLIYGISDLRTVFENDIRFLKQFN
ncbi:MAG: phenylalanine--tRNA ligase subunit alpha [Clostridiales bacterium]|nr:phenylalanine--tRNA ligase subunit alpha [Clostridiales bacterium]